MKYTHVIWDWNGTLVNDIELAVHSMNPILKEYELGEMDKDRYLKLFGFPVSDYYEKIGFDFNTTSFEVVSDMFIENYNKGWSMTKLHNNVEETLAKIKENNISQSILSAAKQDTLEKMVNYFNIRKYFTELIGLDDHHAKSKVEKGIDWIQKSNIDVNKTIMIGDTIHDYEVAKALGCHCALVSHGHQHEERLKEYDIPVLKNIIEVAEYVVS